MLGFTPIASAALTTTHLPTIYGQTNSIASHANVVRAPTSVGKKTSIASQARVAGPHKVLAKIVVIRSRGAVFTEEQLLTVFTPLNPQVQLGIGPLLSPVGGGRFTRGDVVQFNVTFYDYAGVVATPPVAGIRISYFAASQQTVVNGTLTQNGSVYSFIWDSSVADSGNVDWFIYTSNTMRSAAQGTFTLVANTANVA